MGVVLAIRGRLSEAESAFQRAIQLSPKFAEPHFNLGKLLLGFDNPSEARAELEKNLELEASNVEAIELLVDAMVLMHDEDAALALIQSLHVRKVQHPADLHLEIGSALEQHSRWELAAEEYSFALHESSSESERREAQLGLSRLTDHRSFKR